MKKHYLFWILIFVHFSIAAQNTPIFENLNLEDIPSGLFWEKTTGQITPPSIDTITYLTYKESAELLLNMHLASVNETEAIVPKYNQLREFFENEKRNNQVIPMCILEMNYHRLSQNAYNNGALVLSNGQFFQTSSNAPIFISDTTAILHLDCPNYGEHKLHFKIDETNYFHNLEGMPDEIKIDFDDGNGWRNITSNEIIEINYSSFDIDRFIKLEIIRNGESELGGFHLKSNACLSEYEEPSSNLPWATDSLENKRWQISTTLSDGVTNVCGNAYYLPSGSFDKPFIFVEGIDFNQYTSNLRNGDFGWCQFTSGNSDENYDYAMIARMPILLDTIRENGYDIVLLDFCDGATSLENNGALLVHLINIINQSKIGDEPLVIAASSMGGQISKYALDSLERNNTDHCTRLWISLDSPHEGANVPISLQQLIYQLSSENTLATGSTNSTADDFIAQQLKRPAAQQLLNSQWASFPGSLSLEEKDQLTYSPIFRNLWYSKMENWAYPKLSRNVAISNGNVLGHGLNNDHGTSYENYHTILNYNCELTGCLTGPEASIWMAPACGDPWYYDVWGNHSTSDRNISARFVKTYPQVSSNAWYFDDLVNACLSDKFWWISDVPSENINYDYSPGGYRNSVVDFVSAINGTGSLQSGGCNPIDYTDYNKLHCFVTTASAFGIAEIGQEENVFNWLENHPEDVHFERWFGPDGVNEPHSMISEQNLQIFIEEILRGELPGGSPILPPDFTSSMNSGTFNFGKKSFTYLRSVHVHNDAKVYVNRQEPLHYGTEPSDVIPGNNSRFKLTTWSGCAASDILIDASGKLEIGDPTGITTAEFKVKADSRITLGVHGYFIVHPGSTVIFEAGSELQLLGGNVELNGGDIIMKAGSILNYFGGNIILTDGRLVFDGGQLKVATNTTCSITHTTGQIGYVEILTDTENMFLNGVYAKLKFHGTGTDDLLLKINDYAHLQNANFGAGEIIFEFCKVDLSNHGAIWTDLFLKASNTKFVSTNSKGEIVVWYSQANYQNCSYFQIDVKSNWSKCEMNHGALQSSYFKAWGGGFNMLHCEFDNSFAESSSLQMVSAFTDCNFQHDGDDGIFYDESITEVKITNCSFNGNDDGVGIYKLGGKLSLKCTVIRNCVIGIFADKGLVVNMSSSDFAGYNRFVHCDIMIYSDHALALELDRGYNDFSDGHNIIMEGFLEGFECTMDENEQGCFYPEMPASHNVWPGGTPPGLPIIALEAEDNGDCTAAANYEGCFVNVIDDSPEIGDVACGSKIPIIDFTKNTIDASYADENLISNSIKRSETSSTGVNHGMLKDLDPGNPIISTSHFTNIELEEALVIASSYEELIDTLGNDSIAVDLFYQILTSGLDRTNEEIRYKMNWGLRNMKSSLENMFVQSEITAIENTLSFHPIVQQYVDVLNTMTDDNVSDTTYVERFYFELHKAQLFNTLGNSEMAFELFDRLDDCQLDSLEQGVLNIWLEDALIEMSALEQYNAGVEIDSISFTVDTTGFSVPAAYIANEYYFGAVINSPMSVSYVPCGFSYKNKMVSSDSKSFAIFPNPSHGIVNIQYSGEEGFKELAMIDNAGKIIFKTKKYIVTGELWTLNLQGIAAGNYLVRLTGADGVEQDRIVFR